MHLTSFFLGILPLVSAEACYSVITKTSLVTSVVITVSFSTVSENICLHTSDQPLAKPTTSAPDTSLLSVANSPTALPSPPSSTEELVPYTTSTTALPDSSDTIPEPVSTSSDLTSPVSSLPTTTACSGHDCAQDTAVCSDSLCQPTESCTDVGCFEKQTSSASSWDDVSSTSPAADSDSSTLASTELNEVTTTTSVLPLETTYDSTTGTPSGATLTASSSCESSTTTTQSDVDETTTTSAATTSQETPDVSTPTTSTPLTSEVSDTPSTSDCETSTTTDEEPSASTTGESTVSDAGTKVEPTPTWTDESASTDEPTTTSSVGSTSISVEEPTFTSVEESTSTSVAESTSVEETSTSVEESTSTASDSESDPISTSTAPSPPFSTSLPRNGLYPADIVDELRDESISHLETHLEQNPTSGCTLENAKVRREWSDLSVKAREEYIEAVLCLQSLPAKSGTSAPGARSRFDDFLAVHIKQTDYIHNTANFLTWHRYFLFTYEKALKDECGFTGEHPYWNWDRYAANPAGSPLFNGNTSSISGGSVNGACVASGPFKDMAVNMGPGPSLDYNPRCLKRDLSARWAAQTTVETVYPLITQSNDIASFQNTLQNPGNAHAGGHFTIGGDPGSDIYASAGDPAFYLHHAMVDRVYWLWQLQDLETRLYSIAGQNKQTRRQGSLDDLVDIGLNAGSVEIGHLLDTMGGLDGELCYIYA